jgi:hypothetical protein
LALGALAFAVSFDAQAKVPYIAAAIVAAVAMISNVDRFLLRVLDYVRQVSPRVRLGLGIVIFFGSLAYFAASAIAAGRSLIPQYHDEHMGLLQARMLATGRLWMPEHPLAPFFDSFFVIVKPVYAGAYFPGTALLNVPGIWFGLEPWYTAVLVAAGAVTMLYVVASRILDPVAGVLAALLAVSLEQMRVLAVMTMSHVVLLLLFLLTVWAFLHWQTARRRVGWSMAVGALAGWAAITRPLDALCLIAPIAAVMLWPRRLRSGDEWKRSGLTGAVLLGCALPFLGLQLILDRGVTGHWLQTPITTYTREAFPELTFGFGPHPTAESKSPLPQVRDYDREFLRPFLRAHAEQGFVRAWADRSAQAADVSLPAHLLYVLLPVGLLGVRRPGAGALAGGALLLSVAYAFWPPYLKHYGLAAAPMCILFVLLAVEAVRSRFPRTGVALTFGMAALAIASLPEPRGGRDRFMEARYLADIDMKLAEIDRATPAVVLFRYVPGASSLHEEPVYNLDTAWPDDARIIRAQDLGEQNHRIFEYYARHQPSRMFYRYDRSSGEFTRLGRAVDLARPDPQVP